VQYPFEALAPEYANLLARMQITRQQEVQAVANHLLVYVQQGRYADVADKLGIPQIFIATSFEREASSNFRLSPAQGDPWNERSIHVPRGRGPFKDWTMAALDAYTLDGLDKVGKDNWNWMRFCYEGELFNGFGYRQHGVHSPYVWSGSNNYDKGKYTSDGVFDSGVRDQQLGIVPIARMMASLDPALDLLGWPAQPPVPPPFPQSPPLGVGGGMDVRWLQATLNLLMKSELTVDGIYGRYTRQVVVAFQQKAGLEADGLAGPLTLAALENALKKG
jgi:lysozyme family protein